MDGLSCDALETDTGRARGCGRGTAGNCMVCVSVCACVSASVVCVSVAASPVGAESECNTGLDEAGGLTGSCNK
jgi:hypothetical protein